MSGESLSMKKYKVIILSFCMLLTACTASETSRPDTASSSGLSQLAKSDVDQVIEIHQRAVIRDLKVLMVKLYKRNPELRHDRELRSIEESVELTFARPFNTAYSEWAMLVQPNDIVRMAFDERYQGDRIRAFVLGLRKMLMASYGNHTEFFYLTSVDEQKIYNSARNLEIAAWLLADKQQDSGQPFILSDSLDDEQRNLSFQRLIGQMIATQDNLAEIISHKTGRLIKTVIVQAASMAFLPI